MEKLNVRIEHCFLLFVMSQAFQKPCLEVVMDCTISVNILPWTFCCEHLPWNVLPWHVLLWKLPWAFAMKHLLWNIYQHLPYCTKKWHGTARIIGAWPESIWRGTDPPDPGTARHGTSPQMVESITRKWRDMGSCVSEVKLKHSHIKQNRNLIWDKLRTNVRNLMPVQKFAECLLRFAWPLPCKLMVVSAPFTCIPSIYGINCISSSSHDDL